ncbi:unnamed protein product [Ilex paraguariensis]|uniref:Histone H2A n=1 Tax=Ilex paraguariensis TaxID=185542 RepID=A0ABC8U7P0_9AQUA
MFDFFFFFFQNQSPCWRGTGCMYRQELGRVETQHNSLTTNNDKPKSSKSVSRSHKADLQFPVEKIAHCLKSGKYIERVGVDALAYLFVALEYLAAEVLELAGNAVRDNKKNRIVPKHIQLAVRNDKKLSKLLETSNAVGPYLGI